MALGGLRTPHLPPGEDPPCPPNSASPEELRAQPGLERLLQNLGGILGQDGLSPALQKELKQAEVSLGRARRRWLHLELLWRLLGELIRDPRELEPSVLRALEQELTWAQVRRGPPEMAALVPPPQRPPLLPRLLPELQRRLREKREELGNFLLGPPKKPQNPRNPPQNPPREPRNAQNAQNAQNAPNPPRIGGKAAALGAELRRGRGLREELRGTSCACAEVLSRCLALLRRGPALGALQAHLDGGRGRYLQAKGGAVLLKSRLEELRILLDTYPAPAIEAHRRIRAGLSERRGAAEAEAAILGAELGALRALGPEFRALALELGRLRQLSARKRWALRQLRPPPP